MRGVWSLGHYEDEGSMHYAITEYACTAVWVPPRICQGARLSGSCFRATCVYSKEIDGGARNR